MITIFAARARRWCRGNTSPKRTRKDEADRNACHRADKRGCVDNKGEWWLEALLGQDEEHLDRCELSESDRVLMVASLLDLFVTVAAAVNTGTGTGVHRIGEWLDRSGSRAGLAAGFTAMAEPPRRAIQTLGRDPPIA